MSDGEGWKKDLTPYHIFTCTKCRRYIYVKTIQKGKKCLNCGRTHVVEKIKDKSQIILGITAAKDAVIELQNESVRNENGMMPELQTSSGFVINVKPVKIHKNTKSKKMQEPDEEKDYHDEFTSLLLKINESYKKFPEYVIEMMAGEGKIPINHVKKLVVLFLKKGFLIRVNPIMLAINKEGLRKKFV